MRATIRAGMMAAVMVFAASAGVTKAVAELPKADPVAVGLPPAGQPVPPPAQTADPGLFLFWYSDPITDQPVYITGSLTPRGETVAGNNRWRWDWTNGQGSWCDVVIWWNATPAGGGAGRWDIDIALVDGGANRNFVNLTDRIGHGNGGYAMQSAFRAPGGGIQPLPGTIMIGVTFWGQGQNDGSDW